MSKCAFLGLGVMGAPMAGHLARHAHSVKVWNRTQSKAEDWAGANKGEAAAEAADAVFGSEFVFMCLGDDPDVEAVFDEIETHDGFLTELLSRTKAITSSTSRCD